MLDTLNLLLKSRKFWRLVFDVLGVERDYRLGEIDLPTARTRAVRALQNYFDAREA